MDIIDFIVFFAYVVIFYILFFLRRKRYNTPELKKYHKIGFWIKVVSCFAFCMFSIYISPGDSTGLYYTEGLNIYNLILKDPSNFSLIFSPAAEFDDALLVDIYNAGYFKEESNYMVTRIVALLCFLTYGKFMAISLFFSMISFTGVWRLYRFFYEQYPQLHKQFAVAILFLPTFVFWSSGILKDPLCTGAIGWITYCMYNLLHKKHNLIRNVVMIFLFSWLLIVLKIYILVSYLPFFILFMLLKNVTLIRKKAIRISLLVVFFVASIFLFVTVTDSMKKAMGSYASQGIGKSILFYQKNYINQQQSVESNFSLGVDFDGSAISLLKLAPAAIVATLFRPFIWESKKISSFLTSIESLMMMLFTLYVLIRVGIRKFFITLITKPLVLYCFLFAIIFSLFIGATTLNFGSLVRYKIPALPFYVISLYLILFFNDKIKSRANRDIVIS